MQNVVEDVPNPEFIVLFPVLFFYTVFLLDSIKILLDYFWKLVSSCQG